MSPPRKTQRSGPNVNVQEQRYVLPEPCSTSIVGSFSLIQSRSRGLPPISDILSSMEADRPPALSSEFRQSPQWQFSHNFGPVPNKRCSTEASTVESFSSKVVREIPYRTKTGNKASVVKTSRVRRNNASTSSTRRSGPTVSNSSPTSSSNGSDSDSAERATKDPKKRAHAVSESHRRKITKDEYLRIKEYIPKILYPEQPSTNHKREIAQLEILRAASKYIVALVPYVEELTTTLLDVMARCAEEKAINQAILKLLSAAQITRVKQEMAALSLDTNDSTWTTEGPFRGVESSKGVETLSHNHRRMSSQHYPATSKFADDCFSWLDDSKRYNSIREDVIRCLSPEKRVYLDQQEPFLIPVLSTILVKDAQSRSSA